MQKNPYFFKFTIFILGTFIIAETSQSELRLVSVLFRYGDRTPIKDTEMFPQDPYLNHSFFSKQSGQLTNQGKRRVYNLGQFLRNKYNNFLGNIYTPELLRATCDCITRTKTSLQLVLAGLFPPVEMQIWNKNLNWQPIPITYESRYTDNLLLPQLCTQYLKEAHRINNSSEVLNIISNYQHFMDTLTVLTGQLITHPCDIAAVYNTFVSESYMNLTLPNWSKRMFPYGKLYTGTLLCYDIQNFNTKLKRLQSGMFMRKVSEDMKAVRSGLMKKGRKLFLYSGHEHNIISVFKALEIPAAFIPEYSSAIIFELHQLENDYYVKILYYLGIPSALQEKQIPGCNVLCPLNKFLELTKHVVLSNEEMICSEIDQDEQLGINHKLILEESRGFGNNEEVKKTIITNKANELPLYKEYLVYNGNNL